MIVRDACKVEYIPLPDSSRSLEVLDLHSIPLYIMLNLQGLDILDYTDAHHQPSLIGIITLTKFQLNRQDLVSPPRQNPIFSPKSPRRPTLHR